MKILSIVGARPQFIKAAVVSRALTKHRKVKERLLHTGQHYDVKMSAIFFKELGVPKPYKNLNVGSGPHGAQTSKMLIGIEKECLKEKPDLILIYGDTNSTLAGALVAAKLQIPLAHVEAGLRSFNLSMPEEVNRKIADRLSDYLFAPTQTAVENLKKEGLTKGIHRVGDVMIDAVYFYRDRTHKLPPKRAARLVPKEPYFVLTLHRQENTDDIGRLKQILKGLAKSKIPFVFPMHPRTRKTLKKGKLKLPANVRAIAPVSYLEMILLQTKAEAIWTDSGGMQKEAVVLKKPCFTLRDETEWVETVKTGWNQLLGADTKKIERVLKQFPRRKKIKAFPTKRFYGDGKVSEKIAQILVKSRI